MSGRFTYGDVVATPEGYSRVVDAFGDPESRTVLTVAGASRAQVADVLGIDLATPVEDGWAEDGITGWALLEVPGGVIGAETTGFGDPANTALATLSKYGPAAVVRCSILAHYRFGCARGGALVFDDNEYVYLDRAGDRWIRGTRPRRCPETVARVIADVP